MNFIDYWYINIKKLQKEIKELKNGKILFLTDELKNIEIQRREKTLQYYINKAKEFSEYRQNLTGKEKN